MEIQMQTPVATIAGMLLWTMDRLDRAGYSVNSIAQWCQNLLDYDIFITQTGFGDFKLKPTCV